MFKKIIFLFYLKGLQAKFQVTHHFRNQFTTRTLKFLILTSNIVNDDVGFYLEVLTFDKFPQLLQQEPTIENNKFSKRKTCFIYYLFIILFSFMNRLINIISSYSPFIEWHIPFTTIPFYRCESNIPLSIFVPLIRFLI